MQARYIVQGQHLLKTGLPPFEPERPWAEFQEELLQLSKKTGLKVGRFGSRAHGEDHPVPVEAVEVRAFMARWRLNYLEWELLPIPLP